MQPFRYTQKQSDFALYLFQGRTQRDSWDKAGFSTAYPLSMVDSHACRLANSDKIQARLKELRSQTESVAIADVVERKEKLTDILRDTHKTPVTAKERTLAISELNKMEHVYESGGVRDVNVVFVIGRGYKE